MYTLTHYYSYLMFKTRSDFLGEIAPMETSPLGFPTQNFGHVDKRSEKCTNSMLHLQSRGRRPSELKLGMASTLSSLNVSGGDDYHFDPSLALSRGEGNPGQNYVFHRSHQTATILEQVITSETQTGLSQFACLTGGRHTTKKKTPVVKQKIRHMEGRSCRCVLLLVSWNEHGLTPSPIVHKHHFVDSSHYWFLVYDGKPTAGRLNTESIDNENGSTNT